MKCRYIVFLLFFVFSKDLSAQNVETGKIIVQFKPEAAQNIEAGITRAHADTATIPATGLKSFDDINLVHGASNMRRLFPHGGKYEAKQRRYGLHLWYEIIIPDDADPEAVAASYGMDENVQISEPRYKIRRMDVSENEPVVPPNDPNFYRQWNFNNTGQSGGTPGVDIRLLEAWEAAKALGGKKNDVIVAVIDDGVSHGHEDLRANMWVNEAEHNGLPGVDDDNNGYVDDIHGYNFISGSNGVIRAERHATHVAGIIAAATGNATGVAGITGSSDAGYGIKIMTIQILQGNRYVNNVAPAFVYAANNGAVIAQNSWGYENAGYYQTSDVVAINYFINEAGRDENGDPRPGTPMTGGLVIFAAGNDGKDDKWYPAYFDNVMSVAAANHYGKLAWYSNHGDWIDISAPGGDTDEAGTNRTGGIYSTSHRATNTNFYEYMQGTSMACPHVAGVAALILSVYGDENFTPFMLRSRLLCSAMPLDAFDPQNASKMGAGLVNAMAALMQSTEIITLNITDLEVERIDAVSSRLTWTIPENETELGYYIVAYSANEKITEENFNRYAQNTVYTPQTVAATRQITVSGFLPETEYCIAIRNVDNCNMSIISNVAIFTTRENIPPVMVNQLFPENAVTLRDVADETEYCVGEVFFDEDADELNYLISVENTNVATARTEGDMLYISPKSAGTTTLTLTADDNNTGFADYVFTLTVTQNHAPQFDGLITEMTLIPHTEPIVIDLANYAFDTEDDPISFRVQTTDRDILIAEVEASLLTIDARGHGYVALRITAFDPYSAQTTETIHITVEQKYAPQRSGQILAYPNPTSDILWYSFILDKPAAVTVRIVDTAGRSMLQTATENLSTGAHYYNINIQNWISGVYYVQYISDGEVVDVKRVVKL